MCDVRQEQYATVIRELIRHENDLTNHRIMWLLVGQGFLANAVIIEKDGTASLGLCLAGIIIAFSAFAMLYKSYLARGYLLLLGRKAKEGILPEEDLPLVGWPKQRINVWWKDVWMCRWIAQPGDLLEPWLLLPFLFTLMWLTVILRQQVAFGSSVALMLATIGTSVMFVGYLIALGSLQSKDSSHLENSVNDRASNDHNSLTK